MPSSPHGIYKIRIDKTNYDLEQKEVTGRELLTLAGKTPVERHTLYLKIKGKGTQAVGLDETVDLSVPGREKFVTIPSDQTEGFAERRDFSLPSFDLEYLNQLGLNWEAVTENNIQRVIIYDYPMPKGYQIEKGTLNLRIEKNYPTQQIDMVYFYPYLQKTNGKTIRALSNENFDGKTWQRWSRHRTLENPWRAGIDSISTHMLCIDHWLEREVE